MRYVVVILVAVAALWSAPTAGAQGGYTARQTSVITLICDACARYEVDCTLPLAIARRESGFGANIVSQTDHAADGTVLSIGVYQWHAAGLGGYRGPGYEDDWRWDIYRDTDRGVQLITSHLRGGPSYLSHWYTPRGLDTTNLPACMSAWSDESGAARRALTSSVNDSVGQGERLQTGDGPSRPNEGDR